MSGPRSYLAYLLRAWRVVRNGEAVWRASLEDVDTGERHGFASLEALFAYLREELRRGEGPAPEEARDDERR